MIKRSAIDAWLAKAPRPRVPIADGSSHKRPKRNNLHPHKNDYVKRG